MPDNGTVPIIMVGPGTGIAPFRSFWQQRQYDRARNPGRAPKARDVTPEPSPEFPRRRFVSSPFSLDSVSKALNKKSDKSPRDNSLGNTLVSPSGWGEMYLFFGCRNSKQDCIYRDEILQAKDERALTEVHTALSREPNQPKVRLKNDFCVSFQFFSANLRQKLFFLFFLTVSLQLLAYIFFSPDSIAHFFLQCLPPPPPPPTHTQTHTDTQTHEITWLLPKLMLH